LKVLLTNHEMIKRAMKSHCGETLRTDQIKAIVLKVFPIEVPRTKRVIQV
jgi:hypothetical protein